MTKKIYKYFNTRNIKIEEYNIYLNQNQLFKAYKNHFLKNDKIISLILDINFFEIKNNENEIIALAWYGISDLLNFIIKQENIERGFRLRRDNIQIGDQDTLNLFFNEDRFNHHFIGEIYLIGNAFIPNARRDYFLDNPELKDFEKFLQSLLFCLNSALINFSSLT